MKLILTKNVGNNNSGRSQYCKSAGVDLNHNEECLIYCTRMLFLPQTVFFPLQALILVEVKK